MEKLRNFFTRKQKQKKSNTKKKYPSQKQLNESYQVWLERFIGINNDLSITNNNKIQKSIYKFMHSYAIKNKILFYINLNNLIVNFNDVTEKYIISFKNPDVIVVVPNDDDDANIFIMTIMYSLTLAMFNNQFYKNCYFYQIVVEYIPNSDITYKDRFDSIKDIDEFKRILCHYYEIDINVIDISNDQFQKLFEKTIKILHNPLSITKTIIQEIRNEIYDI